MRPAGIFYMVLTTIGGLALCVPSIQGALSGHPWRIVGLGILWPVGIWIRSIWTRYRFPE